MVEQSLGPLEADIMQIIWQKKEATVQEVFDELSEQRNLAYNTVMTVMTRLAQKGMLRREKAGRAFIYVPVTSKKEVGKKMMQYIIDKVFGGSRVPVFSELVEGDELSEDEFAYLEALVEKKKSAGRDSGEEEK